MTVSIVPGQSFETVDSRWTISAAARPRSSVKNVLAESLPASLTDALLAHCDIGSGTLLADFSRAERRRLIHALTAMPLTVPGSRGYNYAEATAGGVRLEEIDPSTMESRRCKSLFLVGEMLDVDGRIGGFNFQWAWSGGRAAAEGITRTLSA